MTHTICAGYTPALIALLSPAKTLDMDASRDRASTAAPEFQSQAMKLVSVLRAFDAAGLQKLMGISANLADVNRERFRMWRQKPKPDAVRAAILAFRGDVYRGFDADSASTTTLKSANARVRILSGLYGVLRPLDDMQAYRLEMGTPLKTDRGGSLYAWWGDRVTRSIVRDAKTQGAQAIINLASNEYAKVVDTKSIAKQAPVITPVFKQNKGGASRVIALFSKEARGMMARLIAEERLEDPAALKDFRTAGYRFRASDSTETTWVFARKQPPPVNG